MESGEQSRPRRVQEPLKSPVTCSLSLPALPLDLLIHPPRKGPQPLPTFRVRPWLPMVVLLPIQRWAGLSSALRLPRARSPVNSTVSVVLTKSSSSEGERNHRGG